MRRIVEVQPVLVEDAPALGAMIRRELEEFGAVELHLGTMPHGFVGGITKTILEPGDPIDPRELEAVFDPELSIDEADERAYELLRKYAGRPER